MPSYTLDDYNQYGVLHVPFLLALSTFYLLKHWLIALLTLIPMTSDTGSIPSLLTTFLPIKNYTNTLLLYSCIPTLFVSVSMAKRHPKTRSTLLRWIWCNGKRLLLSSLLLETGIVLFYIISSLKKLDEGWLMLLYIDGVLMLYLMRSQRVRDVFAEFPAIKKTDADNTA